MPFELDTLLILALLGGLVAVDGTAFGQFMISRPFAAATLGGFVVGQPMQGAIIGAILEAFHLTVLPVGAAKYPEGGPAAVTGGAVFAGFDPAASTLLLAVLLALGLEWLGGESVRLMRHLNVRIMYRGLEREITPEVLERRHYAAILLDFVRGVILVGVGILLMSMLLPALIPLWGAGERIPQIVLSAVLTGLLASTFRGLGARKWMALAGAAAGLFFLWAGG